MKNKSLDEKIAEKKKTLEEINDTLAKSTLLYDITTSEFGALFKENKGKVDGRQTLAGIAALLSRINDLIKTRNDIENEINALLELDEVQQPSTNEIKGDKEQILTLLKAAK
jgi:uncharacterized coiled-coil protein SlyX